MNMIVAADRNWAIGNRGSLLVSIPSDIKFFRDMTKGKIVIMGRKTLESLPGGRPLPMRTTIVLTGKEDYTVKDAIVCHSVEEVLEKLEGCDPEDIFVAGGGEVYREFLPYCSTVHVTKIDRSYEADTWFPDLDADDEWCITQDSDEQTYFDLEYRFLKYERTV